MSRNFGALRWLRLFGQCSVLCHFLVILLVFPSVSFGIELLGEIAITKTAYTSFDRNYLWSADIVSANPSVTLNVGESFDNDFTIYIDKTFNDSNFHVFGTVTIENNTGNTQIVSLSDTLSNGDTIYTGTFSLNAYSSWFLNYDYLLETSDSLINNATAIVNSIDYNAQASVDFANALISEIDEVINVDTSFQNNRIFTASAILSTEETFGPYGVPMTNSYLRFVNFRTNDTGFQGYDDVNFNVNVINPVPEPSTFILLGAGLAGLVAWKRKRS